MRPERIIYLKNVSLTEAQRRFMTTLNKRGLIKPLPGEMAPVDESIGRVTAGPVFASQSSPLHHCAAMDGYSVRFEETVGASPAQPHRLVLGRQALEIDTGDPVPEGFNAVIMIEDVDQVSPREIEITAPVTPWQHVRTMGEDIVATELILPENHRIRPVDAAAMLAGGLTRVEVRRRPRVAVIPTGSELIEPGQEPRAGSIIEFNSLLLAGMAEEWGACAVRLGAVADDYEALVAAVSAAVESNDIVVVNAGSSHGSEDFTVHAVARLGEVLVHGVRIKPGKPVVLGVARNTPVLGIPGYPVSAALDMELFAGPAICALQGQRPAERERVTVATSRKLTSTVGTEEFIRLTIGNVGGRLVATPIQRGAGALMSLVRADGLLRIPESSEGLPAGAETEVELLRGLEDVENTIVAVGSHDIALDLLASELRRTNPALSLSSAHVGSMGGIMALKRGEAHLAGVHLMDEETGQYNLPYIRRYLPGEDISLVNLAFREQGLIVAPGNPKGIAGIEDLLRQDVTFINRQRGAGTRVLLDHKLKVKGLDPRSISGYQREEFTHMGVAAAVLDGMADAGLGIMAAARALGLDFVPVATERYDLAIPAKHLALPQVQALIGILRSDEFRTRLLALGGYDPSRSGELIA